MKTAFVTFIITYKVIIVECSLKEGLKNDQLAIIITFYVIFDS